MGAKVSVSLLDLVEDAIKLPLQFLDPRDLFRVGACCKCLQKLCIEEWKQRDAEIPTASCFSAPTPRERVIRFFQVEQYASSMRNDILFEESPKTVVFAVHPSSVNFLLEFPMGDSVICQGFLPFQPQRFGAYFILGNEVRLDMDQIYPLMNWISMEGLFDCYERQGYRNEITEQLTKKNFNNLDVVVVSLHIMSEQAKPDLLIQTRVLEADAIQVESDMN